jgi:hypothetical protein
MGPEKRRDEETFWQQFESIRPRIVGALLNAVSHGLRHHAETHLDLLPRMADFARWVTACEGALGWEPGTFMGAYREHEAEKAELTLSASPTAVAVRAVADRGWEGTATDLLVELASTAPDPGLPEDPRTLSSELKQIEPVLRDLGVVVTRHRG